MPRLLLIALLLLGACERRSTSAAEAPFNGRAFLTQTLLTTLADAHLGSMAAKKGQLAETRELGAAMRREQQQLHEAAASIARRRGIDVPRGIEQKKAALTDNLAVLAEQSFDRGYALAMVQDLRVMSASLDRAARSNDRELAEFAKRWQPIVDDRVDRAERVMKKVGGSPFGFE